MIRRASLAEVLEFADPRAKHLRPVAGFSRRAGERMNRRGIGDAKAASSGFSGSFATLFPGAYQVVQSDLGLTYGGTMRAQNGNTSTTAVTLTGTLSATPVPIWVVANNAATVGAGANFSVYFDGAGLIEAMNVTPSAGVPVPLTGAGSGASLTWAAGTGATGDGWKATCAALADQSGNGIHYSQATASLQPIVTVGLNGKPGLLFDGVDDFLNSNLVLPAPATTPGCCFFVGRMVAWGPTNHRFFSPGPSNGGYGLGMVTASPNIAPVSAAFGPIASSLAVGTFGAISASFTSSTADYIRAGSGAPVTGSSAASAGCTTMQLGGRSTLFANFEFLMLAFAPGLPPETSVRTAINSARGYGVGAVLV